MTHEPTRDQHNAIIGLFWHLNAVYHHSAEKTFGYHAEKLDALGVPFWVQNNISCAAENRQIYFKNGEKTIVGACCQLDWRPHLTT